MIDDIKNDAQQRMTKSIGAMADAFKKSVLAVHTRPFLTV